MITHLLYEKNINNKRKDKIFERSLDLLPSLCLSFKKKSILFCIYNAYHMTDQLKHLVEFVVIDKNVARL